MLKSATSIDVMGFLQNHVFNTFSVPQYIHSDNAKQFVSKEMQELLALFGITHIKTGLYYLKDETHHLNWDHCIPEILTILRSDVRTSIEFRHIMPCLVKICAFMARHTPCWIG